MKKVVLLMSGLIAVFQALAEPVTREQAEQAVQAYLARTPNPLEARVGSRLRGARTFNHAQRGTPLFHAVALEDGGFVVTSADTGVSPIIAISEDEDLIASEENHLWALLNRDLPQRMDALAARQAAPRMAAAAADQDDAAAAAERQWAELLGAPAVPQRAAGIGSVSDVRVAPLMQSTWNQSTVGGKAVYNYYTPSGYVCGCVATAGAQVMRYHQFPAASVTADTYSCWVNGAAQNLTMQGGTYSWADMPLNPTSSITDAQREAIGRLTYDVGVASRMSYASGGSGAHDHVMVDALKDRFGYASGFTHLTYPGTSDPAGNATVRNALLGTLDAGLPAVLGISGTSGGHAIVADGYGYNAGVLYAHLNMGWGGSQDAWYNCAVFNVSSYNYTLFDDVSFNISPNQTGEWITGRTLDGNSQPLFGLTVTASNKTSGATYTAASNAKGIYAVKVPSATATYGVSAANGGTVSPEATVSVQASTMCRYAWSGSSMQIWPSTPGQVGNRWGNDLTVPSLSAPSGVTASQGTYADRVSVSWSAAAGATSYKVFRNTADDSAGATQIGASAATVYDDTTAVRGSTYHYWVKSSGSSDSTFSASAQGWRTPYTLGEALDSAALSWTTGGNAPWFTQNLVTHDGLHAAQSGAVSHSQSSWVQATVTGPGTLAFWWRVSSEASYDWLTCTTNGAQCARISGTAGSWAHVSVTLPAGATAVRWTYSKDTSVSSGSDCGWLDGVTWTPVGVTQTTPAPVPFAWLDEMYPAHGGDYEALAHSSGLNGYHVWESFVAGLDPTNAASRFLITVFTADGTGATALDWAPRRPDRVYTVWGNASLDENTWHTPTNSSSRFFRVRVELPNE